MLLIMLTTSDLNAFVAQDSLLHPHYQGTFPKDWFIEHVFHDTSATFPKAYIFNTDDSQDPGTHWISVYRPEEGQVEVFDSYGLPPRHWGWGLLKMLAFMGWKTQQRQEQPLQYQYSTLCGVYCLYMLHHRVRGWTFQQVVDTFHPQHPFLNDALLLHWYHRHAPNVKSTTMHVHPWTRMLHQCSKPFNVLACPF